MPIWLTPGEVASALKISPRTIEKWRQNGTGPRWTRLSNGMVRYRLDHYLAWCASRDTGPDDFMTYDEIVQRSQVLEGESAYMEEEPIPPARAESA
jgi:phage terminase Nu1 subunit (DNA packaging protein)